MKWSVVAGAVALGCGLSACAYQAPVVAVPNLNVYTSYSDKLPGDYLLFVDDDSLITNVHATGVACGAHSYPLDARAPFKDAVRQTLEQLVEHVTPVDAPVSSADLAAQGKAGMIIVKGNEVQARFAMVPGFWTASAEANVDLTAAVSVDGAGGRLFGTEASGTGHAEAPAGGLCSGPANALADATGTAMKQLLGQLGERMSNSPRLRTAQAGSQTGMVAPTPTVADPLEKMARAGQCAQAKSLAGSTGDVDGLRRVVAICGR